MLGAGRGRAHPGRGLKREGQCLTTLSSCTYDTPLCTSRTICVDKAHVGVYIRHRTVCTIGTSRASGLEV